jgi:hypothetical protein
MPVSMVQMIKPAMQNSHSTWDWAMMYDLQHCFICCSAGFFFLFLGHPSPESLLFGGLSLMLVCNRIPE